MYSDATHLSALLDRWARQTPNATAIEDQFGRSLTYGEMNRLVNLLAARMAGLGVRKGDRIGICMPKSINSVLSVFGALRAGAAYVPVDYSAPAERNQFIFRNCQTRVICADGPRREALGSGVAPFVEFPGEATDGVAADMISAFKEGRATATPGLDDLSYILYTSGSTGVPKGVIHTHRSALSFVYWAAGVMQPTAADRFSSHAPFHFDLSILDLYVPMTVGAAVIVIGESLGKEPGTLAPFIAEKRITCWYSVPSILAMLAQHGHLEKHDYSALRIVNFAGEVFPVKHLRLLKGFWKEPGYYNLYGPTETNVCTYHRIPEVVPDDRTTPYPIGKLCENCEGIVLDEDMQPVSGANEGILYVRASGPVMKEYWSLPDLNAKVFHTDSAGRKWYRTGDVVTTDENGDYLFVGRRDRMVKRRGYRIELGEIEAGLYKHPQVREAAAVPKETPEGVTITVYLSAKDGQKLSIIAMKQFCSQALPSYMNPDRFVFMPDLPRTSTGKVDYQTLAKQG